MSQSQQAYNYNGEFDQSSRIPLDYSSREAGTMVRRKPSLDHYDRQGGVTGTEERLGYKNNRRRRNDW